jgi:hypothetical protein
MPTYEIKNITTGEVSTVTLRISEYEQLMAGGEHTRHFSVNSTPGFTYSVGDLAGHLGKKHPGFVEVIDSIKQRHPNNRIDSQLTGVIPKR